jgi:hypothetical protein
MQAINNHMVPQLIALYKASQTGTDASGNSGSSTQLHSTISYALLLLLKPPVSAMTTTTSSGTGGCDGIVKAAGRVTSTRATSAAQHAAGTPTAENPQESLLKLQGAQACVGRHCNTLETITACMQLLSLGRS